MISRHVRFTGRATLYPGVIIECDASSTCTIGDGVVLYPGVRIVAAYGGSVSLGAGVLMGEGGGSEARADRPGSAITIADRARLTHGAQVLGHSDIGVGAQIIGQIVAQSVTLADGEDSSFPDPDRRGGVLKGIGIARSLSVGVGEVVNGLGDFSQARAERQRSYHPDAPGA